MKNSFLIRLKELMQQHNIKSQYRLAQVSNISLAAINNWFRGVVHYPSDKHLVVLAEYFKVHPAWLKYGEHEYTPTLQSKVLLIAKKMEALTEDDLERVSKIIDALNELSKPRANKKKGG